jgi:hypothetical protein
MHSLWNMTTAIGFLLGFLLYQSLPGNSQGFQSSSPLPHTSRLYD